MLRLEASSFWWLRLVLVERHWAIAIGINDDQERSDRGFVILPKTQ